MHIEDSSCLGLGQAHVEEQADQLLLILGELLDGLEHVRPPPDLVLFRASVRGFRSERARLTRPADHVEQHPAGKTQRHAGSRRRWKNSVATVRSCCRTSAAWWRGSGASMPS